MAEKPQKIWTLYLMGMPELRAPLCFLTHRSTVIKADGLPGNAATLTPHVHITLPTDDTKNTQVNKGSAPTWNDKFKL